MKDNQEWIEDPLPTSCPPEEAYRPENDVFYRLVESFPPKIEDFYSIRKLFPERPPYTSQDECVQRSCSVFSTYKACENVRKTLKKHRAKRIAKLVLPSQAGVIKQTCSDPDHYSLWMNLGFDPVPLCQIPDEEVENG